MAQRSKQPESDVKLETTVMALRETLMQYFKGSCVARLTDGAGIECRTVYQPRMKYQYQRLQAEAERAKVIYLGGVSLMTVRLAPDRLVYHTITMGRSPQLKQIHKMIDKFLDHYLPNVQRSTSDANIN